MNISLEINHLKNKCSILGKQIIMCIKILGSKAEKV